ncbi:PilN domain-containing protein [Aquincola sp. MAHUQ-54]|uniref:PilN domain-containing protein n=1 Tax=Aquincola agrisoli TaxID=3119538 RepID=A0AAW9PZ48_9BURK
MTALHLDFLHPRRRLPRAGLVLLAAGVLLAGGVAWQHGRLAADTAALGERLAQANGLANRSRGPLQAENPAQARAQAQALARANTVLASLNQPWNGFFQELESVAHRQVTLLSIQPEADGRRVRLGGEARRYEQVLDYVARLEATDGFAQVFLASHAMREGPGGRTVVFTLSADWVGNAP